MLSCIHDCLKKFIERWLLWSIHSCCIKQPTRIFQLYFDVRNLQLIEKFNTCILKEVGLTSFLEEDNHLS